MLLVYKAKWWLHLEQSPANLQVREPHRLFAGLRATWELYGVARVCRYYMYRVQPELRDGMGGEKMPLAVQDGCLRGRGNNRRSRRVMPRHGCMAHGMHREASIIDLLQKPTSVPSDACIRCMA